MKILHSNKLLPYRLVVILALLLLTIVWLTPNQTAYAQKNITAQENISLASVAVDIWPEYDKPSVLVMYNISLSSDVKLPATLTMRIPSSAGQPYALAAKDTSGLFNLQYQTNVDGEWTSLTFTTSVPEVRLEYYDPSLKKSGAQREYTYQWPGDYAVSNLTLSVQQPATATNMTFTPEITSGVTGQDGLTYYSLVVGQVKAGNPLTLNITYTKPNDQLTNTNSFQQVNPSQPINEQTPGRVTLNEILPWVLGALGFLLITVGGYWYWRSGRATSPVQAGSRRHPPRRSAAHAPSAGSPTPGQTGQVSQEAKGQESGTYCSQCGKRAGAGDVFCRTCGTRLK